MKLFAYLSLASIISIGAWISIQFYIYTESIVQMAINFVTATPGLPNILALETSFFLMKEGSVKLNQNKSLIIKLNLESPLNLISALN